MFCRSCVFFENEREIKNRPKQDIDQLDTLMFQYLMHADLVSQIFATEIKKSISSKSKDERLRITRQCSSESRTI